MPYTLTRKANHQVHIEAHLEPPAVAERRRDVIGGLRGKVQIPGFRKGRAPEAAVTARFADEIRGELLERLADELWREVMASESDLQPLTEPHVHDLELADDGSFRMTAHLEVRPRLELPDPVGATLPEVELEPTDAEVDEEVERLRAEHATWEPAPEAVAADGVLVEADLHGQMEGSEEPPFEEKGAQFVLQEGAVPAEIQAALQGAAIGDTRTAERQFAADDPKPERAGKSVRYTIEVTGLKQRQLPDVDDELAATVGLESLDELRDRIRGMLAQRKRAQRRETWRRAVLDHLEQGLEPADLPPSLVQAAIREDLNRFAYSMAMRGQAEAVDQLDWNELSAKAEPAARRRVLDSLVLEQLAEEWQVDVPEAEVDAYLRAEASRAGVPPAEHKATVAKEGRLGSIRHAARVSATVDELIRRAGGEVD